MKRKLLILENEKVWDSKLSKEISLYFFNHLKIFRTYLLQPFRTEANCILRIEIPAQSLKENFIDCSPRKPAPRWFLRSSYAVVYNLFAFQNSKNSCISAFIVLQNEGKKENISLTYQTVGWIEVLLPVFFFFS